MRRVPILLALILSMALALPGFVEAGDPQVPGTNPVGMNRRSQNPTDLMQSRVTQMKALVGQLGRSLSQSETPGGRPVTAADLGRRQEQLRTVRAIREKLVAVQPQLPPGSRGLAEPLRLELERLSFLLASGEDSAEVTRRLGNAETLVGVLFTRMSMACGACSGKGRDSWGNLCKVCGGDGYVVTPNQPKPCAACNGKGRDSWGNLCNGCKGTGWAGSGTGHGTLSSCAFCQGKGRDSWGTLCTVCGGDGFVITGQNPNKCAACNGSGRDSWGSKCGACKGCGWADYLGEEGENGGHHHHHGDWSLKTCGTCSGAGRDSWGNLCKPCGGDGYVAISGQPLSCAACSGKGKNSWGNTCPACQGTGWANTGSNPTWEGPTTSTRCGMCSGTGRDSWGNLCKVCGGDGYISAPEDKKTCAACGGRGRDSWGNLCSACKGEGCARSARKIRDFNR